LDENGAFIAPACPGAQTCARLIHPAAQPLAPWVLTAGVPATLEVELAPSLRAIVRDTAGEAIADAEIILRQGAAAVGGRSDLDGAFSLALPRLRPCDPCDRPRRDRRCRDGDSDPGEPATVLVQAAGHEPLLQQLSPERDLISGGDPDGNDPRIFTLGPPQPSLRGSVVDALGATFDGRTRVLARSLSRQDEAHAATADQTGHFEFDSLGLGVYGLRAVRDGIELATGEAQAGEQIRLESPATASGPDLDLRITDDDGRPRAAVRVDGGPFTAAETDDDGRLRAERVVPGTYTLRLTIAGCEAHREEILVEAQGVATVILPDCS
ncbi:MAG: carboxypeptidase regulatory-like domain-containing protein, partial [Myxococcales bacterium]|nr:carboxypeptidase regulatory-like domain-containing protein [Myxococcales bacterium]